MKKYEQLTAIEYQKIYIKPKRDIKNNIISYEDAESLRKLALLHKDLFFWGSNYLAPQQWIGVITINDLSIEILPKISTKIDINNVKEITNKMLSIAYNIPMKYLTSTGSNISKFGFIELLINHFVEEVEKYINEGLIFDYVKIKQQSSSLKGKLIINKQINSINKTKFYCSFNKFISDNNINQFIKFILILMKEKTSSFTQKNKIQKCLFFFENVSYNKNPPDIKKNKINNKLIAIIEIGKLFISGFSYDTYNGNSKIKSFLFDMNKLFELFIFNTLKYIYKDKVKFQDKSNFLIQEYDSMLKKIKLKPDIIYSQNNKNDIFDTKWKIFKNFSSEEDVYQMNAYAGGINNVNSVTLLYPKINEESNKHFIIKGIDKPLFIKFIDLTMISDIMFFHNQIKELLEDY